MFYKYFANSKELRLMFRSLRGRALKHLQRILTQDQIRHQRSLKRQFLDDFESLKDDIDKMNQSLKNIVELLKKLLEETESSAKPQKCLFVLTTISKGLKVSQVVPEFANFAFSLLSFSESVLRIRSYHKTKEIWDEILRNMRTYKEIADLTAIRNLLSTFVTLNKSSITNKQKRQLLKREEFLNDGKNYASSSDGILTSFSTRLIENLWGIDNERSGDKGSLLYNSIFHITIPGVLELNSQNENINLKKNEISEKILSLETKIQVIEEFLKSAERIF